MKKKDLVDLFLRSPKISILIPNERLFDTIAKEVILTVKSRYRYSNFTISNSGVLRSPYLGEQLLKRICLNDSSTVQGYDKETTYIIHTTGWSSEFYNMVNYRYTIVCVED